MLYQFSICLLISTAAFAQPTAPKPYSQRMADSFLRWYPDSLGLAQNKAARWGYEQGLMLLAIERAAHWPAPLSQLRSANAGLFAAWQ
jgi:unsaturated rhamnogalacturonyl hydrolase